MKKTIKISAIVLAFAGLYVEQTNPGLGTTMMLIAVFAFFAPTLFPFGKKQTA
jgi:hypothetical protein